MTNVIQYFRLQEYPDALSAKGSAMNSTDAFTISYLAFFKSQYGQRMHMCIGKFVLRNRNDK